MGLLEVLTRGDLGVELVLPAGTTTSDHQPYSFQFAVPGLTASWWVFFFPQVFLDLSDEGWPSLRRDVERHTRALFETTFRDPGRVSSPLTAIPRTADGAWSPVVTLERVAVENGEALHVLHRVTYEPGSEILMGHLLIPSASGLAEIRWVTAGNTTGYREASWVAHASRQATKAADFTHPGQAVFDDPALDPTFPDHPLSVARAARRWLSGHLQMRVTRRPQSPGRTEIELPSMGCALIPPPRFKFAGVGKGPCGERQATMNRASFAGSDGIDWFLVSVITASNRATLRAGATAAGTEVAEYARRIYLTSAVQNIRTESMNSSVTDASTVVVEGDGHLGPLRMVARGIELEAGSLAVLCLTTSATLSKEEMSDEVEGAARAFRLLRPMAG